MNKINYPVVNRLFPYHGITCNISFWYCDEGLIRGYISIPFDAPVYRFSFTSHISYDKFKMKILEFTDEEIQTYVDKIVKSNRSGNQPGFFELKEVIIPFLKLLMQLLSVLLPAKIKLTRLLNTAASKLSKWSMTDVFVIALIVSYLAGNADGQMGDMLKMKAELGIGFWFFTAYCIVAIASSQFVERIHKAR